MLYPAGRNRHKSSRSGATALDNIVRSVGCPRKSSMTSLFPIPLPPNSPSSPHPNPTPSQTDDSGDVNWLQALESTSRGTAAADRLEKKLSNTGACPLAGIRHAPPRHNFRLTAPAWIQGTELAHNCCHNEINSSLRCRRRHGALARPPSLPLLLSPSLRLTPALTFFFASNVDGTTENKGETTSVLMLQDIHHFSSYFF